MIRPSYPHLAALLTALSLWLALGFACQALADPCEAPVTGYEPGDVVRGPVVYEGDGDSLCLALGAPGDASRWLEIRLADFFAPELSEPGGRQAKAALTALAHGRQAVCTAEPGHDGRVRSYDRIIARCTIGGRSIGDAMRAAGIVEGGRGR